MVRHCQWRAMEKGGHCQLPQWRNWKSRLCISNSTSWNFRKLTEPLFPDVSHPREVCKMTGPEDSGKMWDCLGLNMFLVSTIIGFRNHPSIDICPVLDIKYVVRNDSGAACGKVTVDTTMNRKGISRYFFWSGEAGHAHGNTLKLSIKIAAKPREFLVCMSPLLFLWGVNRVRCDR